MDGLAGRVGRMGGLLAAITALSCAPEPAEKEAVPVETHAAAVTVPSGLVDESYATGIESPTQMEFAPDGRLFVAEQRGRLRVVKNGATLSTPFVSLTVDSEGERGLLGIAFDPAFASNGFVYVYYTTTAGFRHNRLSRFTANGDVAVAGSEVVLVDFDPLTSASNHNGGAVHIGGDGKLYVAVGDNATSSNAQTLSNRHGKMHRYNLDGSIPSDNPFFGTASGANRSIWALGLRNPFTFAVQPGSGVIFINDVGQNTWEEVNRGAPGANYAWPRGEGPNGNGPNDTAPVYSYDHSGGACSIAGGTFYNPSNPQLGSSFVGHYFFADYCAGWIRRLNPATNQVSGFATGLNVVTDLKTGPDGALYYLSRGGGSVRRIRANVSATAPRIDSHPTSVQVAAGQSASFSVTASGTAPLAYQWQRNGTNISGATSATLTLGNVTSADNGAQFRAIVSNSAGSATSNSATLTVLSNQPPVASISAPATGTLYAAGETISYAGSGQDAEDGTLPPSAFTWEVVFHHDTHTHPFVPPTSGATTGSFTIPTLGETATNVWYRIHLRVRDSAGLVSSTSVDVRPRTANLTLQTVPAGLQVTLDGQAVAAGGVVSSVVGMTRTIAAPSPQSLGGKQWEFVSWSDGGAASHDITTPEADATWTATFAEVPAAPGEPGLTAAYFDNRNFTNLRVTRVDPGIDFNWGTAAPAPGVGADTFSVRWTGTVTPATSERYTFTTRADDGIRFYLDETLLIDNWRDQSATERSVSIDLVAGRAYAIRVDYYDNTRSATARLFWATPTIPRQIVPTSALRTTVVTAPPPPTSSAAIRINFQSAGSDVPDGYLADTGAVFGDRGGASFGWDRDHGDFARDREINPDQRLDTFCYFHQGGVWELAVANGTYQITVSTGDARDATTNTINVEGVSYFANTSLGSNQFSEVVKSVTVNDGRLTIDAGASGEKVTRINYVEVAPQ
ncbi:MAG TPA: PQQ-dependent sugar dehydrogenase [Polyangia bacterium]